MAGTIYYSTSLQKAKVLAQKDNPFRKGTVRKYLVQRAKSADKYAPKGKRGYYVIVDYIKDGKLVYHN